MTIREAQTAGRFYAANNYELKEQIKNCFLSGIGPGKLPPLERERNSNLLGLIVPHAGYIYSGPVAAWAYLEAAKITEAPQNIILIGPNHTGYGQGISIYPEGAWSTPFGNVDVNKELSAKFAEFGFSLDEQGHLYEHSIEVQLPFLQFIFKAEFKIVCISMLDQSLDAAFRLANCLAEILKKESFLLVATTDLTHYETEEAAKSKDRKLISSLQKGDPAGIYKTAEEIGASACGLGPAACAIKTGELLEANQINLLKYETSATTTKESQSVVGYAALSIKR